MNSEFWLSEMGTVMFVEILPVPGAGAELQAPNTKAQCTGLGLARQKRLVLPPNHRLWQTRVSPFTQKLQSPLQAGLDACPW